eukprot:COSAG02_NODE_3609_length_6487_cov_68.527239_2_plen_51_part_00
MAWVAVGGRRAHAACHADGHLIHVDLAQISFTSRLVFLDQRAGGGGGGGR